MQIGFKPTEIYASKFKFSVTFVLFKSCMKNLILFTLILLGVSKLSAQSTGIYGTIKDLKSGEVLIGANIYSATLQRGVSSNSFGYYSMFLPIGTHSIRVSYVGYESIETQITVGGEMKNIEFELEPNNTLKEAKVVDSRNSLDNIETSKIDIKAKDIKFIPAILGEIDVIKALQLLPGVNGGTEASSGMYVRGGGNDQNLILLDGVPLYNVSHLFGFFSLFNSDAINSIQLYKGAFPSRFGGRLSSVLDIQTIDGNRKKIEGNVSIGIIASRLSLNGPLTKNGKTTFAISARRTFLDLFIPTIREEGLSARNGYYFYDLNGKVTHHIDNRRKISFSIYNGADRFYTNSTTTNNLNQEFTDNYRLGWGNNLASIRYSSEISPKLFASYTASFTQFKFGINANSKFEEKFNNVLVDKEEFKVGYKSDIIDFGLKADYEYKYNNAHLIRFGANVINHRFTPGYLELEYSRLGATSFDTIIGTKGLSSYESAIYLEDDFKINNQTKLNVGLRYVNYLVNNFTTNHIEPRIGITHNFNKKFGMSASYTQMNQFVHLVANSGVALPTDLWVPASEKIKPMNAQQFSLGFIKPFGNGVELVIETYYKWMDNVIDYREGFDFELLASDFSNRIAAGTGRSYGIEILLQKQVGKWKGWLAQTYSKTDRTIPEINFGRTYPFKYDRRVDISLTLSYEWSEKYTFSTNFVYATGNALTVPIGQYRDINGTIVNEYGNKNGYRMRDYHRLDFGFTKTGKNKFGLIHNYNLSLYNVYARLNPFSITTNFNNNPPTITEFSLFAFLPGFTYNLKF